MAQPSGSKWFRLPPDRAWVALLYALLLLVQGLSSHASSMHIKAPGDTHHTVTIHPAHQAAPMMATNGHHHGADTDSTSAAQQDCCQTVDCDCIGHGCQSAPPVNAWVSAPPAHNGIPPLSMPARLAHQPEQPHRPPITV